MALLLDLDFTAMGGVLDPRITFTRSSTGTYYNSSGVLSSAVINAARFDYDPVTHAPKGLLIEGPMTNALNATQDFTSGSWTKTGVSVTANAIAAPDGTLTADLITTTATTASISQFAATDTANPYAQSIFVKKGTSNWCYLLMESTADGVGTPRVWFNLTAGTKGTVEAALTSADIQDVGGGWYRLKATRNVGASGVSRIWAVGVCDADNSSTTTVGTTIYLWGAQVEQSGNGIGSSYMPSGARAADVVAMIGTNFTSWYNNNRGKFVAEFDVLGTIGIRGIVAADNGVSTSQSIRLYGSGTDPKATIISGSVTQADLDLGTLTANVVNNINISYATNDIAASFNGGVVGTDTVATLPAPTQLRIGYDSTTAANYLHGHIRKLQYSNDLPESVGKIWRNVAGIWKVPEHLFVKQAGVWKDPIGGWVNVAGTWKKVYPQPGALPTLDLDFLTGVLDPRITFTRASTATYFNAAGVLTTATANVPRFDYDPVTHAPRGLLIESSRTNGLLDTENFSTGNWNRAGATITVNQINAPDGVLSADLITASASPATVSQGLNYGTPEYVGSVFAKKGTSDWFYLCPQITGDAADTPKAWFNLATGTVGTVQSPIVAVEIQDCGNGWYRCSVVRPTGIIEWWMAGICDADGSAAVTAGKTIHLWGAQLETDLTYTGYRASSYIPAGVTRAADNAVMTGSNYTSWHNSTVGTYIAEFDVFAANGVRGILVDDAGPASNETSMMLYSSVVTPKVKVQRSIGGVQADISVGTLATNTVSKIGGVYAANDVAGCFNGGTVGTDTVVNLPAAGTELIIGWDNFSDINYLNGHMRKLKYYNVRKSNADLQALTT